MNRCANPGPPDRSGQRLTNRKPVSERPERMQSDMANHLGSASFHDDVTGAGSVHLGDALLFRELLSSQPQYPLPGGRFRAPQPLNRYHRVNDRG